MMHEQDVDQRIKKPTIVFISAGNLDKNIKKIVEAFVYYFPKKITRLFSQTRIE